MRYFVFSDIHGDGDNLMRGLNQAGYEPSNPNHQIISCGDNFGRAQSKDPDSMKSAEIFAYLTSSIHHNKPICLIGNHEEILLDVEHKNRLDAVDIRNGEHNTLASFIGVRPEYVRLDPIRQAEAIREMRRAGFFDWIRSCPFYFETEHYIFTHGFIPMHAHYKWNGGNPILTEYDFNPNWRKANNDEWFDATWCNTRLCMRSYSNQEDKTFVLGHFSSFYFRGEDAIKIYNCDNVEDMRKMQAFEPYYDKDKKIWFIDQTQALKNDTNTILVIED